MIIKFEETDLASRASAGVIGRKALEALDYGVLITFDLSSVKSMSGCYADELVGVLYRDLAGAYFLDKFSFVNMSDDVAHTIVEAIEYYA